MREGDELGINQKRLMRELNQYSEDVGSHERWSPERTAEQFSDDHAKAIIDNKSIEKMYENPYTSPSRPGRYGRVNVVKELDKLKESRVKKSTKPKSKRSPVKKSKKTVVKK